MKVASDYTLVDNYSDFQAKFEHPKKTLPPIKIEALFAEGKGPHFANSFKKKSQDFTTLVDNRYRKWQDTYKFATTSAIDSSDAERRLREEEIKRKQDIMTDAREKGRAAVEAKRARKQKATEGTA